MVTGRVRRSVVASLAVLAATLTVGSPPGSATPETTRRPIDIGVDLGSFGVAWSPSERALYEVGDAPVDATNTDVDSFVRRFASDGRLVWQRRISSPRDDHARGVAVAPNGDVVVAGWRTDGQDDDAVVARFSSRGTRLWTRVYDTGGDERAHAVAIDEKGLVVVAGRTPGAADGSSRIWWSTWSATGRMTGEWFAESSIIGVAEAHAVAARNGRVAIAGSTFEVVDGSVSSRSDAWVAVVDTDGVGIWTRTFGRAGEDDAARGVAIDTAGRVYLSADTGPFGGRDIVVRAYTAAGTSRWRSTVVSDGDDRSGGIAASPDGFLVTVVGTLGVDGFESDAVVRTHTSGGGVVWTRRIDSPGVGPSDTTPDRASAVVVPGPVVVVGAAGPVLSTPDPVWPWIARFTADHGRQRWAVSAQPFA